MPKHVNQPNIDKIIVKKIPNEIENPNEYLRLSPIWSFKKFDIEHEKWGLKNDSNEYHEMIKKLKDYEGMTWESIEKASGGKKKGNGTNSHSIPFSELISDAQRRLRFLKMDDCDEVFSLRFTGKKRLIGIRTGRTLHIIWHDCNHEICISKK